MPNLALYWLKEDIRLSLDSAGPSPLAYPSHKQDGENSGCQEGEKKARESSKNAGHFLPACCKDVTKAQRNDRPKYLTIHIPEQKVTVRLVLHSR